MNGSNAQENYATFEISLNNKDLRIKVNRELVRTGFLGGRIFGLDEVDTGTLPANFECPATRL